MLGKLEGSDNLVRYLPTRKLGKAPEPAKIRLPGEAPPKGPSYVPMVYKGGPLMEAPELVALYWGSFSAADVTAMQSWLTGLANYLSGFDAPVGQDQVLLQYGTFSATVGAHYHAASAPTSASEADVKNKIIALQGQGHLPAFAGNRLFIVMTKGVTFNGYGSVWCAYHGHWGSGQYFAICPYPTSGGCEPTATALGNLQYAVSHETMEAATDPVPGTGWVEGNEEGGDTCNQVTISMSFGILQKYADNLQKTCSVWAPHNDQANWRWCHKCQGMYFAGNGTAGACPAGAGHDHTGSGNYRLPQNLAVNYGQTNWRWCHQCQGLFFNGNGTAGICPSGGGHSHTGSGNYNLVQNALSYFGQPDWRWCKKCQGLFFNGNGTAGHCPAQGGHSSVGSGNYVLRQ